MTASTAGPRRLATTALDGKVRLYAADLKGAVRPTVAIDAPGGHQPHGIAFSPLDGMRLAVGYTDSAVVTLLDGQTLAELPGPDVKGITGGDLAIVAWSLDGGTLFAAGMYHANNGRSVLAWSDAGAGTRRILQATRNTAMTLAPLPDGDLLVAAADPWLGRLRLDGTASWTHGPPQADFAGQWDTLSVSNDGTRIGFGFAAFGQQPAMFDLTTHTLTLDPPGAEHMATPRQDGLPIEGWLSMSAQSDVFSAVFDHGI